jgi:serine protease Do
VTEVGEKVAVIGSPKGLETTVSDGIVSAVREVPGFGSVIQTTAPISPGSSGSPVVNMKAEVLGVASAQIKGGQKSLLQNYKYI